VSVGGTVQGTPLQLVAVLPVGGSPDALAYDGQAGQVLVVNSGSGNVSVIADRSNSVTSSVQLGGHLTGDAFDPITSETFVADSNAGSVDVILDANDSRVGSVSFGALGNPAVGGVAYNPAKGQVLVVQTGVDVLGVICDAKRSPCYASGEPTPPLVEAELELGPSESNKPTQVAYDAYLGLAFVTDSSSNNVSVVSLAQEGLTDIVPVGSRPAGIAYDENTREIFVANEGSNNVSVISDVSDSVIATIAVGSDPTGVAVDPSGGELFVTNSGSNNVSVISVATDSVLASIPVGTDPSAVVYDTGRGELFVANQGSNTVSVLSDAAERASGSADVPLYPWGLAYDPTSGEVFVTNRGPAPDNVTGINDTTGTVEAPYAVGDSPTGVAYDPTTDDLYVANAGDGTLSVVSASTGTLLHTIPVGEDPGGAVYDAGRSEVFVSNTYTANVSIISTVSDRVVASVNVGLNPEGLAYDPANGEVFVVNYEGADVSAISDATNTVVATIPVGSNPVDAAYDPAADQLFVTNAGGDNLSIVSLASGGVVANVTVGSSPAGVAYDSGLGVAVVANSGSDSVSLVWVANDTVVQTVPVGSSPEGVVYDAGENEVYVADEGSSNVTVLSAPAPSTSVTFQETGITGSPDWSVRISGGATYSSTSNVLSFQLAPGSYAYAIPDLPGLTPQPSGGTLAVLSAALTISVSFAAAEFPVTFSEGSLPTGTTWWVNVSGAAPAHGTSGSIVVNLTNGTFQYVASADVPHFTVADSGTLTVIGAPVGVAVTFSVTELFSLMLGETGLPSSADWWLNLTGGSPIQSTGTSLEAWLPNGTYTGTVGTASPSYELVGGPAVSFTVADGPVSLSKTFGFDLPAVYFTESGLPFGTSWSVDLGGVTQSSVGAALAFVDPLGTYPYTVDATPGYTGTPGSGTVDLTGEIAVVRLVFSPTSSLSVQLQETPNTVGAPEPGPLSVQFNATATGGSPPYAFSWQLGNGATDSSENLTYTYTLPGTFLVELTVTDAAGASQSGFEAVEVGTSTEMTPWIPAYDAYSFGNPGSIWASGGNCFGMSSTAALYFDSGEGVLSGPSTPDDPAYFPAPLAHLSEARAPGTNAEGQWNTMDNVTLAIYLHQTSALNHVPATWNNSRAAATVLSDLETTGEPVVIALGPQDLHAVVIYGAQTFSNGSTEFAISDPNTANASLTTHAWFVPPDTFHYSYIYSWVDFGALPIGPFFENESLPGGDLPYEVHILAGGWQLVEADSAVTVTSNGMDSFTDGDGGNSQTFVSGIPRSAGIEEPALGGSGWQAYAVPPGDPSVSVDPSTASLLRLEYGSNRSGTLGVEGVQFEVNSSVRGDFTVDRTPDGATLSTGNASAQVSLWLWYATNRSWEMLRATNLSVGAGETASFDVTNWDGLNSSSVPSVSVVLGSTGSHGTNTTYSIVNGQNGLSTTSPPPPGGPPATLLGLPLPAGYFVLAAAAAALIAAAVIAGRRGRKGRAGPGPAAKPSGVGRPEDRVPPPAPGRRGP
jgi:YVTN family beta-propeller protein